MSARAVAGDMAKLLAARLEAHGYRVMFPPGRDPAVFKLIGLPGRPCVEVTAEDNGQAACHYTGRSAAEAARVIARLPVPGQHQDEPAPDTVTAAWDGIEIEWQYQPPAGTVSPADVAAALLAHLAVLDGRDDRPDVTTASLARPAAPGAATGAVTQAMPAPVPGQGRAGGPWLSCC